MYARLPQSTDSTLGYEIRQITRDEVIKLEHEIEQAISKHGKIRVLLDLRPFPYADVGAFWEDVKFARHAKGIERAAVIGDRQWEKWATRIFGALSGTATRYFERSDAQRAWEWLGQSPA